MTTRVRVLEEELSAALARAEKAEKERDALRERYAVGKEPGYGLDTLMAYVRRRMAEIAAEGGIYDNGFICVDEAEEVFEVDAESFAEFAGRLEAAKAEAKRLTDLLLEVWGQFAIRAPGVEANCSIADGAPAYAGGLSTLEDVAEALEAAGRLETAGVAGKDWWRVKR